MLDRILLTNDDGIDAPGLAVLEEIAAALAREVWVVAPEHDQSGVSHAISLHHALRIAPRGRNRWAVTGTPGDCAAMGICHIMKNAPPSLMLSGVNRGVNLGIESVFSGTQQRPLGAKEGRVLDYQGIWCRYRLPSADRLLGDTAVGNNRGTFAF